jgi:AraC-like DNA-binding protein
MNQSVSATTFKIMNFSDISTDADAAPQTEATIHRQVDEGAGYLPVPPSLVDHVEALVWSRFNPAPQERQTPLMPHGGLLLTVSLLGAQATDAAAAQHVSYVGLRRLIDANTMLRTRPSGCTSLFALLKPAGALSLMREARIGESDSDRFALRALLGNQEEQRLIAAIERPPVVADRLAALAGWLERLCLHDRAPVEQRRLARALALMHAHPTISLPDLWHATGLGRRSLERHLRAWFGTTPKQQQRLARLQHSARLAWQDTKAVDIAHELGFADQPHFSRTIHKMTGMTAGVFMKRMDSHLARVFRHATGGSNLLPCRLEPTTAWWSP